MACSSIAMRIVRRDRLWSPAVYRHVRPELKSRSSMGPSCRARSPSTVHGMHMQQQSVDSHDCARPHNLQLRYLGPGLPSEHVLLGKCDPPPENVPPRSACPRASPSSLLPWPVECNHSFSCWWSLSQRRLPSYRGDLIMGARPLSSER